MERKTFVAILAHPDDEAFFASGTLAKMAKTHDVYIISATKGEAGEDAEPGDKSLGERRADEMRKSAKILGVKEVIFLDFADGTLANNLYANVVREIKIYLEKLKPEIILSFPPTGNTGHLDHIAVSHITSFVFYQLPFIKEYWQVCFLEERAKSIRKYYSHFVYVPLGYSKADIDKIVDTSDVWEQMHEAIYMHKSQLADIDYATKEMAQFPKEEYIRVIKK